MGVDRDSMSHFQAVEDRQRLSVKRRDSTKGHVLNIAPRYHEDQKLPHVKKALEEADAWRPAITVEAKRAYNFFKARKGASPLNIIVP